MPNQQSDNSNINTQPAIDGNFSFVGIQGYSSPYVNNNVSQQLSGINPISSQPSNVQINQQDTQINQQNLTPRNDNTNTSINLQEFVSKPESPNAFSSITDTDLSYNTQKNPILEQEPYKTNIVESQISPQNFSNNVKPVQTQTHPTQSSPEQIDPTQEIAQLNSQSNLQQETSQNPTSFEIPTVLSIQQDLQNKQNFQKNIEDSSTKQLPIEKIDKSSNKKYLKISDLLDLVVEKGASDLHLTVGYPPFIRIDDRLVPVGAQLTKDEVKNLIYQTLNQNQKELLEVNREVDLSYQHLNKGRFRINAYFESGALAAAYRLIPQRIKTIDELSLPSVLLDFTRLSQGLFLVTGPTGSGKSTTLAAMIQSINASSPKHIITIEDPIEYVYPKGVALVNQRELGSDTHDWSIAMKSALRQDPDVLLIGELRDFETIQLAITLAETGHLVFATLHTNSAAQSIDRIIDVFPPHQQQQIKTQLAGVLKGILSQRLVPLIGGGRQAVVELLIVTPAVQNLIREGKTYQIDNIISTSADIGMISLEKSLVKLVRQGKITTATAQDYAIRPQEILKLMKTNQI